MSRPILYPSGANAFPTQAGAPSPVSGWEASPAAMVDPLAAQQPGGADGPAVSWLSNVRYGGDSWHPPTTRRLNPQQPQSDTWVPGAIQTTNLVLGGDFAGPSTTKRLVPQQPQSDFLPPGAFATTNTTRGADSWAPNRTNRLSPQQPQADVFQLAPYTTINTRIVGGVVAADTTRRLFPLQPQADTLPPLGYTTTNTAQGGEVWAPPRTTKLSPLQPQSDFLPPGFFVVFPNTRIGGDAWYPPTTRHLNPLQPQSDFLPPGKFATTNTQFGADVWAPPRTTRTIPIQPQSDFLPPGFFVSFPNTQLGGDVWVPGRLSHPVPVQPINDQGLFPQQATPYGGDVWAFVPNRQAQPRQLQQDLPLLTTQQLPNTTQGGAAFAPQRTSRLNPIQPPSETLVLGFKLTPLMSVSPTVFYTTSVGNTVVVTGVNTAWTNATIISVSAGTITGRFYNSPTSFTLTYSAPATSQTVVFSDSSDSAVATALIEPPPGAIAFGWDSCYPASTLGRFQIVTT